MLKSYFKIGLRNLRRHPGYTFINVLGLAMGVAACLLIGLWVQDELSYDRFHENADRTYRVLREFDIPDLRSTIEYTPSALAPTVVDNVAAIEMAVRVSQASPVVQRGTKQFVEPNFIRADDGFFDLFSFEMVRGDEALDRPGTLVLSEAMATKYFPEGDPVGQTLRVGDDDLEVTGVMANVPANSHLQFDFVSTLESPPPGWGYNNFITYVLLRAGQPRAAVSQHMADLIQRNTDPEGVQAGNAFIPHLQPITGIHLGQGVPVEIGSSGNILYVYLFAALAVFILLLACINFMNLATARSAERAKEVGMRKTLGARRAQLATQFLSESVLISICALVLGFLLCRTFLPLLNDLSGKELSMVILYGGPQILVIVGLSLLVGLLAGSYPALVLSGYQPARVLKGTAQSAVGSARLRKGLVVFQFALSIALIAGTAIVFSQLQFMKSQGLGFDQQHVLLVERAGYLGDQRETFEQEIAQLDGVTHVTSGFSMPGTFFINSMWQPVKPNAESHNMDYSFVGYDYIEALGIEMKAGRGFSRAYATDSSAVILNEAAARDFGWTADQAIGQKITRGREEFTIVGVTTDFHYRSLHAEVYPLALFAPRRGQRYVAARLVPDAIPQTLDGIQRTWKKFSDLPLEYSFLADNLAAQYRAEDRLASIFSGFAILAILIGCLGLFGLAAFTAQQRTKEIGVRKVLGAGVANLIALLSKDFLKLVLIAFFLAVPLAYFGMQYWLEDFAYRIDIGAGVFLVAGVLALVIAMLTVSYHALRAALADPVKSLRYE